MGESGQASEVPLQWSWVIISSTLTLWTISLETPTSGLILVRDFRETRVGLLDMH